MRSCKQRQGGALEDVIRGARLTQGRANAATLTTPLTGTLAILTYMAIFVSTGPHQLKLLPV